MDIKEIALKVGAQGLPIEGTAHKFCVLDFCSKEVLIKFAEALVTEIAKQNDPVDYTPGEWSMCYSIDQMQAFYMSRLPAIREAAKEHGYAIGLHGSARRDFDLMAMPWRDGCSSRETLAHAVAQAACGIDLNGEYQWEKKPNGRWAVSMCICWTDHSEQFKGMLSVGHIDLSVMEPPAASQIEQETAEACAKYVNCFLNGDGIQDEAWIRDIESGIRRGTWKEFKK